MLSEMSPPGPGSIWRPRRAPVAARPERTSPRGFDRSTGPCRRTPPAPDGCGPLRHRARHRADRIARRSGTRRLPRPRAIRRCARPGLPARRSPGRRGRRTSAARRTLGAAGRSPAGRAGHHPGSTLHADSTPDSDHHCARPVPVLPRGRQPRDSLVAPGSQRPRYRDVASSRVPPRSSRLGGTCPRRGSGRTLHARPRPRCSRPSRGYRPRERPLDNPAPKRSPLPRSCWQRPNARERSLRKCRLARLGRYRWRHATVCLTSSWGRGSRRPTRRCSRGYLSR